MSKAIQGAAELAGAVAMGAAAFVTGGAALAIPGYAQAMGMLVIAGISSEIGAIAQALTTNRGVQVTDRRPASNRTVVYGTQMVGGTLVYESVTGHQYNQIIVLAGHTIHSIQGIFLDGRKVIFKGSGNGWGVRNGVGFGGDASNSDQIGPDGVTHYNFGGKVYVEARYGDQPTGDVMGSMTGNDSIWAYNATTGDAPSLQGCTYIYLKCVASSSQFPQRPEVKILLNGKTDILDPRTGLRGFTNNNALVLADVITDTQFGLGDDNVDQTQLIAAANLCDEQVAVAALSGATESRYCCDYAYDTGTAPADVMATMLAGMAGRISYVGGKWFIFPGAYVGSSMSFDASALTASVQWNPARSVRDLPNRVTGTHISAEYPYSVAGNYYQNRQTVQNTFDLKFTQSSYPYYAQDVRHGYPNDEWLNEDNGHIRPMELGLPTVLSLTQCQRVAKINLLRARARQGTGALEMRLDAYKLQPCNVLSFTFSQLGWNGQVLEIVGTTLKVDKVSSDQGEAYSVRYMLNVQQTDPSIYAWSTSEELTIYAAPAAPTQTPLIPNPPTNLQLSSGANTAIVGQDGSVTPVIQVTWNTPLDNAATGIAIQYQLVGQANWYYAPTADISLNVGLISTVVAGLHYNIRIATVRANGALSSWVEQDNFLVPTLNSFLGQLGAQWPGGANLPAPGADVTSTNLPAELLQNGSFEVQFAGWTVARNLVTPIDTMEHHSGSASARLRGGAITQTVVLTVGRTYRAQVWVKTNGSVVGNGSLGAGLNFADPGQNISILSVSGGTQVNLSNVNPGVVLAAIQATDWTLIQMTLSVNVTGSYRINLEDDYGTSNLNAYAWFDEASVIDVGNGIELLQNGGFESGFTGWSIVSFPPLDLYQHKYGNNSLYLLGGQASQNVILLADHTYVLQGWVMTNGSVVGNGSQGAGFSISDPSSNLRVQKTNGTAVNSAGVNPGVLLAATAATGWTQLQMTFHCNTAGSYQFNITDDYGTANANAGAWFDGVTLMDTTGAPDVTSANTSNDTSYVSGVPSSVIASVVPTGYKLIINNGTKTYSIEAI